MDSSGNVMTTGGKVLNINDYTPGKLGIHFDFMS